MANKVTPRELQEGKVEYMILDVREADELQEGKIDGAVNIPLGQLIRKARHGDIDDLKGKKIITYCNSGYRGNIAADEFHVTGVQGDVSSLGDLDHLYDRVKQQKGRIDLLFANAGVIGLSPLGSISEDHFDTIFNINVKGLLFTVQKALPLFQNGGSIILNASINGSKGFEGSSVYSATKAAIRSFVRSWTVDLKHRKIRVNAISPGPIDTPITNSIVQSEEHGKQLKTMLMSSIPMGRMGNPDKVAKAVSFLASDDSSFVTGIELFVDGGMAQI